VGGGGWRGVAFCDPPRRASTLTRPGVLAGALAEVLDEATAARAAELGSRIVPADRAVAAAADAIDCA
jgi:sterol 3beta-glucosyltransferase